MEQGPEASASDGRMWRFPVADDQRERKGERARFAVNRRSRKRSER
jgi:hypothetical protein